MKILEYYDSRGQTIFFNCRYIRRVEAHKEFLTITHEDTNWFRLNIPVEVDSVGVAEDFLEFLVEDSNYLKWDEVCNRNLKNQKW